MIWISQANPLQTEQILEVFLSAFVSKNPSKKEELTQYFYKKMIPRLEQGHLIHLIQENGRIIGFALFEKWLDNDYYLAEMAICPKHQRKGLGKRLIFGIFDKDPSANKILLIATNTNYDAHCFYEAIGFNHSSFQHPDYPENFIGFEYHHSL